MEPVAADSSDEELWRLVQAEDGQAFGVFFDRHRDRVFAHGFRLVKSQHEAEDVTAMVFLEAWRCRKRMKPVNGSLLGWLLVTTNNVARNQLRSRLRYRHLLAKLPGAGISPDHSETVAGQVDAAARSAGVQKAFLALNRREQEVLMLCVLEEIPVSEVSSLLKVPPGTVKSRLSRAKQHLAALLRDDSLAGSRKPAPEGGMP